MEPVAVLYENEAWMAPVFAGLHAAGAPYERVNLAAPGEVSFDPAAAAPRWSLAVNKISPSSYVRGHGPAIPFARALLPFLEARGIPVVNGSAAFRLETSKALQLLLLQRLGVRAPRARIVTERSAIMRAASHLRFPVIVKPNVGGSGALMRRFGTIDELADAAPSLDLGPDGTLLVQEYLETADGSIVRVEFLDGEFLYAIRITNDREQDFNLCPADICQVPDAASADALRFDNNPLDAPAKKPLQIERHDPPREMIDAVLRIAREGRLDVGGVEYLVASRDGLPYVYDINALSNFVTDAPTLVGFDPHERFARWLVRRATRASELVGAGA